MNNYFIIISIIILVILFFFEKNEQFNIYNFNEPYFIKDNKYGYYLLVDSNLNVYWDKSFTNSGNILFNDPLSESTYVPIKRSTDYGDTITYLYTQGEKILFNQYNNSNPMLLFNNKTMNISTVINNEPQYLIINQNGSYQFTQNQSLASVFLIVPVNTKL